MRGVLVTGATTPIGAALVRALLARDDVARVLATAIEAHPATLPHEDPRLTYVPADLTRSRSIRTLLHGPARALGVEAVVHTALHRSALDTGTRVHRLNVESTRELLRLSERHPTIRRFVFRSFAEVYRVEHDQPDLADEHHPLACDAGVPQRVRDRVEADMLVCARAGLAPISICVLRCAEILAPSSGSQVWDYLRSAVCLRPMGFDPMVNLLTIDDAVRAMVLAVAGDAQGVFNIPGADTLPLSRLIRLWGRREIPMPGPLMAPLYRWRARLVGLEFRYDLNRRRLHFSGLLDGEKAARVLGYRPEVPVVWPERARSFKG